MSHAAAATVNAPWREAPRPRWRGVAVVVALHAMVGLLLWTGLDRPAPLRRDVTVAVSLLPEPVPVRPVTLAPPRPVVNAAAPPTPPVRAVPSPPTSPPIAPPVSPPKPMAPPATAAPQAAPRAEAAPAPAPVPRAESPALPAAVATPNAPLAQAASASAPARVASAAMAGPAGASAATPSAAVFQPVGVACPVQVRPEMPRRANSEGIDGVVKVSFVVRDGRVVDVTFLSVPVRGMFESSVRAALARYRCQSPPGQDVKTEQEIHFELKE